MRAPQRAVLFVAALLTLSGCVVEGKLDASGGARLSVRYRLVSVANFDQSKARMQSPDVRLASASMTPDKWATFDLELADVRKLSTAPTFASTTVALTEEADGSRTLAVTVTSSGAELPAPYVKYLGDEFRLSIGLPGDVVRSNATTVAGRTATWVVPLAGKHEPPSFSVTFKPAPASSTPGAGPKPAR
jgi:hypothetical protein